MESEGTRSVWLQRLAHDGHGFESICGLRHLHTLWSEGAEGKQVPFIHTHPRRLCGEGTTRSSELHTMASFSLTVKLGLLSKVLSMAIGLPGMQPL